MKDECRRRRRQSQSKACVSSHCEVLWLSVGKYRLRKGRNGKADQQFDLEREKLRGWKANFHSHRDPQRQIDGFLKTKERNHLLDKLWRKRSEGRKTRNLSEMISNVWFYIMKKQRTSILLKAYLFCDQRFREETCEAKLCREKLSNSSIDWTLVRRFFVCYPEHDFPAVRGEGRERESQSSNGLESKF